MNNEKINLLETEHLILFNEDVFSNSYLAPFLINNIEYISVDQYYLFNKALLFNDDILMKNIMSLKEASKIKEIGDNHNVQGYSQELWLKAKNDIMMKAIYAKFSQNTICRDKLLATENKLIAEAKLDNLYWGIGFVCEDPKSLDIAQWIGKNHLGKLLMAVRQVLKQKR